MTKEELRKLAATAANSAPITRIAEGVKTIEATDREWAKIVRQPRGEIDLTAERETVVDHMGRARVRNGLGEWIA